MIQKTDGRVFFQYSLEQFSQCGYTLESVSLDLHADGIEQYDGAISPIKALNAISTAISTLESFKIENIS